MIKLSIIVCTYNRDAYILKTLSKLKNQTTNNQLYEVIIINNNSTDNTEEICREYILPLSESNFYYFNEKKQGLSFARNRGITEAKGEIIAFIDDDARACDDYCEKIISFFENDKEAKVIGGKITPEYESKKPAWMSKYLLPLVAGLDMGDKIKEFRFSKFPIGANMAFRRSVFENYGYFNESLGRKGSKLEGGEEKDMIFRLKNDNQKIIYVPQVHVHHFIPDKRTQKDYIKYQAIGVGTSEKKRLHKASISIWIQKILLEFLKVIGTLILSFYYFIIFEYAKALMLLKIRIWIIKGFFSN